MKAKKKNPLEQVLDRLSTGRLSLVQHLLHHVLFRAGHLSISLLYKQHDLATVRA